MKKVDTYTYEVVRNEEVTFSITPVGTAGTVKASENGKTLPNSGTPENPEFAFDVTKEDGKSHYAKLEFAFQPRDEETAKFEITLSCSHGSSYDVTPVRKNSPIKDPSFTFEVTASS